MATGKVKQDKGRVTGKALPVRPARPRRAPAPRPQTIRAEYVLDRPLFARLLGVAPTTLARWENNGKLSREAQAKLRQVAGLLAGLSRVLPKAELVGWLTRPNDACRSAGGRTPADLMEKGRYDKIQAMIYFFESGVAY
jgi:transcriptional regulator with XRE-family HTH domain